MAAPDEQLPGAEFLQRRLARATAIPAAERTPDVAAFLESVQLLREACDLLPLTADGGPVLHAHDPAARQQVLSALLKTARARWISPFAPVCDRHYDTHLRAYLNQWAGLQQRQGAGLSELEQVLFDVVVIHFASVHAPLLPVASRLAAAVGDRHKWQRIGGQMEKLAGAADQEQLPLNATQLEGLCCHDVLALADTGAHLPLADAQRCSARLLQLEPQSPKAVLAAARFAMGQEHPPLSTLSLAMQAYRLAQQQHNDFMSVQAAQLALGGAATADHEGAINRSTLAAAAAAYEHVQEPMRRCKRFLPQKWVAVLESIDHLATGILPRVQASLQGHRVQPDARTGDAVMEQCRASLLTKCDGCGLGAVGLRRCARCKKTQYCSTECQRQHWRVHKPQCLPA